MDGNAFAKLLNGEFGLGGGPRASTIPYNPSLDGSNGPLADTIPFNELDNNLDLSAVECGEKAQRMAAEKPSPPNDASAPRW